jgi:hypothetical protein
MQWRRCKAGIVRRAILFLGAAIGLGLYFWRLSLTVSPPTNLSDYATNLLYGQSMLNGNFFLHGWVTLQDPMWFGDMLYAIGLRLRGFDPALLHLVPVAVSTALVILAAWTAVAGLNMGAHERLVLAGVAILPLVLPSPALAGQILVGPNHTDTTAAALAAILALAPRGTLPAGIVQILLAILGGALLAVGRFGDPYMLALGIVPLAGFAFYAALVQRPPLRNTTAFRPMAVALAAWAAAEAGLWLVPHLGGFTMRASVSSLITVDQLGGAVLRFIRAFLDLSGANFFGMSLGSQLMMAWVRFGYLCTAVWAVTRVLGDFRRGAQKDWTTGVLALAVLVSGAGTFLYPGASYAFQVPVFLLMGIVLARYLATTHRQWITDLTRRPSSAAALLVCGLVFAGLPIDQFQHPQGFDDPSRYPQLALSRWLEEHGLRQGYGPYGWASIITVETRGRITVRPLVSTKQYHPVPSSDWRLIPNTEMMGNSAWYTVSQPGAFLIVDNEQFDDQTALRTFGPPDQSYRVAGVEVFVYTHGILCTVPQSAAAQAEEAAGVPPRAAICIPEPAAARPSP